MRQWAHIAALAALAAMSVVAGASLGGIQKETLRQTGRKFLLLRCAAALAMGADTGLLILLTYRCFSGGNTVLADMLLAGGCLAVMALLCFRPVSLFPEDSGMLLSVDYTQQRRFTICLWQTLSGFALYAVWMLLLLLNMPTDAVWVPCLGAAVLLWLFWLCSRMIRAAYERLETIVDKQYQAELLNFMQVIRSQRHDFNFHMQAVAGMIENREYEKCGEYVRAMVKNAERFNDVLPLRDPAISALLNTFREIAISRGVQMDIRIQEQMEDLPCTVYEINAILGNLLQNAIDETEKNESGRRWITLLIMRRSRRHIIKVSNPCEKTPEDYENIFHPGYSTKSSHEGIGLVTVRRIAEKYGGTVYLEHDPGVVHFIARLPVKTEAEES